MGGLSCITQWYKQAEKWGFFIFQTPGSHCSPLSPSAIPFSISTQSHHGCGSVQEPLHPHTGCTSLRGPFPISRLSSLILVLPGDQRAHYHCFDVRGQRTILANWQHFHHLLTTRTLGLAWSPGCWLMLFIPHGAKLQWLNIINRYLERTSPSLHFYLSFLL